MVRQSLSRCSLDDEDEADGDEADGDEADEGDEADDGDEVDDGDEPMMETKSIMETKPMMETKSLCSAAHSMMKAKPLSRCSLKDGDKADDEAEAYVPLLTR